ncbi:hypothetical protein MKX03_035844, partial [Papaver bracteatum]
MVLGTVVSLAQQGLSLRIYCAKVLAPSPNWPADVPKREDCCWADLDYCKNNGLWHPASKIMAEKAPWDFAKETGLDVV